MKNKRASLDLSVNSIVVMVIAFVVLGLILTFTRGIFSFGQGQLTQITNVVDLAEKPTLENPIVPRSFNLKTGQAPEKTSMGVYNTKGTAGTNVEIGFGTCIGTPKDTAFTGVLGKPKLQMIPITTLNPSASAGITALVSNPASNAGTDPGLPQGNFVCQIKTTAGLTGNNEISVQVSVTVE